MTRLIPGRWTTSTCPRIGSGILKVHAVRRNCWRAYFIAILGCITVRTSPRRQPYDWGMSSYFRELEERISTSMQADRFRLRNLLRAVRKAEEEGGRPDESLEKLLKLLDESNARREKRQSLVPRLDYDESLPVVARREEIAAAFREHQVVVVCGETGSGKSTQLPKICLEIGRGVAGMIGHTQPRRIAARSIASRLGEELRTSVGQKVGFKIRFTDTMGPSTLVKVMTDGVLLAESQHDRFLDHYDMLIIDEAHERSLHIDFL